MDAHELVVVELLDTCLALKTVLLAGVLRHQALGAKVHTRRKLRGFKQSQEIRTYWSSSRSRCPRKCTQTEVEYREESQAESDL
jgi:hypothetical protein